MPFSSSLLKLILEEHLLKVTKILRKTLSSESISNINIAVNLVKKQMVIHNVAILSL